MTLQEKAKQSKLTTTLRLFKGTPVIKKGVPLMEIWVKLSASEQRKLFGFALFGRKSLRYCDKGIETMVRIAYGMDYHCQDYSWEKIEAYVAKKQKV